MKVISYSLWGDNPKYVVGALENIKNQKELFPDWVCRFYVHPTVPENVLRALEKEGAQIYVKYDEPFIKHMDAPGMFWRFEVLKDTRIERCMVRDTDGRLTQREKNCVIDWERTGAEFHIIRDNVMHGTKIMGGMWGATKDFIHRINYDNLLKQFTETPYQNIYCTDQEFLARKIYPLVKDTACIHDDWDRYGEGARRIPHLRIGKDYIGQPIEL